MNEHIRAGMRIPLPDDKKNFLSLSYARLIVKVINAFLNLRTKNGQLLLSDYNGLLDIDTATAGVTSNAVSGLPWQIEIQDTADGRTVKVTPGIVEVARTVGGASTYAPGEVGININTNVNITIPAGEFWYFWVETYYTGTDWVAELVAAEAASFPSSTTWPNSPAPLGFDLEWANPYNVGYAFIGYADATVSPMNIVQYQFGNILLTDNTGNPYVRCQGAWTPGVEYRRYEQVSYGGNLWFRSLLANGDDGGTPGVGPNDWSGLV